jgi:hypothetical protein
VVRVEAVKARRTKEMRERTYFGNGAEKTTFYPRYALIIFVLCHARRESTQPAHFSMSIDKAIERVAEIILIE